MRHVFLLFPALALSSCATTSPVPDEDFVAHFNEPFLTYVSEGAVLTQTSPENMDGRDIEAARSSADGWKRFKWDAEGATIELRIKPAQCFDDMAGLEYSHIAQLLDSRSDAGLSGCARLTSEPQPREE